MARSQARSLGTGLRAAVAVTAIINLVVGLAFLFGPELKINPWPTPLPPLLMRFIGSIVLGNSVGSWLIVKRPTWENARILFAVALVYGIAVLPFLLYHLLVRDAPQVFWIYAAVDALFLGPIAYLFWRYERRS